MIDDHPVQSFDLPEHVDAADHVAIYPTANPDGPNFHAVPYAQETTLQDGTVVYDEILRLTVTDAYREAVTDRADIPADDLRLEQPELTTVTI